jgi:DNA-binding MarR family transcriptional regulator
MNRIKRKFNSVVELARRLESEQRPYGTDTMLSGVEIHLVELIGDNRNPSVTELAGLFGVTKGAVSQRLKQLERKGVARKDADPSNASRSLVTLTSKGMAAYYSHKHWHETMDEGFKDYFRGLDPEKLEFIEEFLTRVEAFFKKLLDTE